MAHSLILLVNFKENAGSLVKRLPSREHHTGAEEGGAWLPLQICGRPCLTDIKFLMPSNLRRRFLPPDMCAISMGKGDANDPRKRTKRQGCQCGNSQSEQVIFRDEQFSHDIFLRSKPQLKDAISATTRGRCTSHGRWRFARKW